MTKAHPKNRFLITFILFLSLLIIPSAVFASSELELSVKVLPPATINDFDFSFNEGQVKGAEIATAQTNSYSTYLNTLGYLSIFFPPLGVLSSLI